MSRSLKKGPFVANHLLKKVQKLNDQDDKKLSKLGHDHHNCPNYDWSYNCTVHNIVDCIYYRSNGWS
jgi:hypothetical protein